MHSAHSDLTKSRFVVLRRVRIITYLRRRRTFMYNNQQLTSGSAYSADPAV